MIYKPSGFLYALTAHDENGYHYHAGHLHTTLVAQRMESSMAQTSASKQEAPIFPVSYQARQRLTTTDLMQGAREVILLHRGEEYVLRITKTGKLILTK
jgi:hemin uptake protein HemP